MKNSNSSVIDSHPYLIEAIKTVGIGKKGSKELPAALIDALIPVLKSPDVSRFGLGAFLGALILKGISQEEQRLQQAFEPGIFSDHLKLVSWIASDASPEIQTICVRLLKGETLDRKTAERTGDFLMSSSAGEAARGMIAGILRVRYETDEEYAGILTSIGKTFEPAFKEKIPAGAPIVQIAEPFDGVDHSNMITPLVADFLQKQNYCVVSLCGRNSGPKFGNNLYDIAQRLNAKFLKSSLDLKNNCHCEESRGQRDDEAISEIASSREKQSFSGIESPKSQSDFRGQKTLAMTECSFGFYLDQKDLSKAMDRWVDIRHQTVKRPFMATLERFVNPFKADICIASAFHPPYGEKMLAVAEGAGFPKAVIIRNGIEGTMAFALKRPTKILCSRKNSDGSFQRRTFECDPEHYLGKAPDVEEILEQTSPENNAALITAYAQSGRTANSLFDQRVKLTCAGLVKALEFVNFSKNSP